MERTKNWLNRHLDTGLLGLLVLVGGAVIDQRIQAKLDAYVPAKQYAADLRRLEEADAKTEESARRMSDNLHSIALALASIEQQLKDTKVKP